MKIKDEDVCEDERRIGVREKTGKTGGGRKASLIPLSIKTRASRPLSLLRTGSVVSVSDRVPETQGQGRAHGLTSHQGIVIRRTKHGSWESGVPDWTP